MPKVKWNSTKWGPYSYYSPLSDELGVSGRHVDEGRSHLVLAHEMAHRREGLFTNILSEPAERVFWKELAVWESAMDRRPDVVGDDKAFILDSLHTYLEGVEDEHGKESLQYREAEQGFKRFVRRYL